MTKIRNKTLREVCSETGVSRRAIQGYEKAGLVRATGKNNYGHLLYSNAEIERIRNIKFLQQIGFSIKEIQQFMDVSAEVKIAALLSRIEMLEKQRLEISELILKINQYISG